MSRNFLTPDELEEWTGYKRRDMIVKQLRRWKVRFWTPPDGWPRVHRSVIEGDRGNVTTREEPNLAAIRSLAAQMDAPLHLLRLRGRGAVVWGAE